MCPFFCIALWVCKPFLCVCGGVCSPCGWKSIGCFVLRSLFVSLFLLWVASWMNHLDWGWGIRNRGLGGGWGRREEENPSCTCGFWILSAYYCTVMCPSCYLQCVVWKVSDSPQTARTESNYPNPFCFQELSYIFFFTVSYIKLGPHNLGLYSCQSWIGVSKELKWCWSYFFSVLASL